MADRSVSVKLKADISNYTTKMNAAAAATKGFANNLDTSNGRMSSLVQTSLALGPALVPIGAAAIPAVSGLANQLGVAAAAAGVTALAFNGVGDALTALNKYQLEPTSANFAALQQVMANLGPAGRDFVRFIDGLQPKLQELQDVAQAGLFPGVEKGLRELMKLLPQAKEIVGTVATTLGDLVAEAGDNLNDPRWREFFTFLESNARPTLLDMGRALGNFTEGFANLWMAFDPLSQSFSDSFLSLARDFREWTSSLGETQGFQEFVAYVQRIGPKVWDTLGSIADALLQIVEATAPIGEAVLPVIGALADGLAAIAGSPVGSVLIGAAAGFAAVSRAVALFKIANAQAMWAFLANPWGLAAAGIAATALALEEANDALSDAVDAAEAAARSGSLEQMQVAYDQLTLAIEENRKSLQKSGTDLTSFGDLTIEVSDTISDKFGPAAGLGAQILDKFTTSTDEAAAKQKKLAVEMKEAKREARAERVAALGLKEGVDDVTLSLYENIAAHNERGRRLLAGRNKEVAFEQAMDDARKEAKRGTRTLNINTDAGRKNELALEDLATSWNALTPAQMKARGGSKKVRKDFIETAKQMGANQTEAEKMADKYLDIPGKVDTESRFHDKKARAATRDFKNYLNTQMSKFHDETVNITFKVGGAGTGPTAINRLLSSTGMDSGGTVSGQRYPYGDKVLRRLAPGEEVITNRRGEADHFRALRDAGMIPGMESGGRVTKEHVGIYPQVYDGTARNSLQRFRHGLNSALDEATDDLGAEIGDKLEQSFGGHRTWPVPGHSVSTYPGHMGVDINGPNDFGDPVRAAAAGRVTHVGYGRGYGNAVMIRGPYGEVVYGHLSDTDVSDGQYVFSGQQIGNVGSTGHSTGPHLHFGFTSGGTSANALAFLRGSGGRGYAPMEDFGGKSIPSRSVGVGGQDIGAMRPVMIPVQGGRQQIVVVNPESTRRAYSPASSNQLPPIEISMPANASPGDVADELLFALRRADRGGVYAGSGV